MQYENHMQKTIVKANPLLFCSCSVIFNAIPFEWENKLFLCENGLMRIEANRGLEYERRRRRQQQKQQQTHTYWTKTFCNMRNQSNIIAPLE